MLGFVLSYPFLFTVFLYFLMVSGGNLYAQMPKGFSVYAGMETTPQRPLENTGSTKSSFKSQSYILKANVPLWTKRPTMESPRFTTVMTSVQGCFTKSEIQPDIYSVNQLQTNLGLTFLSAGRKNIYLASVSGALYSELEYGLTNQVRPVATVLFNRKVSPNWGYYIGFGYSFVFGRGIPLPLTGFSCRVGQKGRLHVLLPYRLRYSHRHSKTFRSQFGLGPKGSISLVAINTALPGAMNTPRYLRSSAFAVDYTANIRLSEQFQLQLGGGFLFRRQIRVSDDKVSGVETPVNYFSSKVKPGLFIEAGIRFRLGRKKMLPVDNGDKATPEDLLPDSEDLRGLDLEDL